MKSTILFDFDGVILDSMPTREYGFRKIFEMYEDQDVKKLIVFHNQNGGLSRYVKIKYFYEEVLNKSITSEVIESYANKFSVIMKEKLTDKANLIPLALKFIENHSKHYNLHIVSGSDEVELNYLCKKLNISHHFISINGSPTPKNDLVKILLTKYQYKKESVCLIGDSKNDYDAAVINNIKFYGFNNDELKGYGHYINDFTIFE